MYQERTRNTGSVMVEAPIAIWLLFVLFTIPFIDLASIMLRYTFMVAASRDSVHAAAKAKSFISDLTPSDPSATSLANTVARQTSAAFSEITVTSVTTRLLVTDVATGSVKSQATVLSKPADSSANVYQFETTVTGLVNPLVPFLAGPFPGIPGLSAPVPVSVSSSEFCENPQGLTR